MDQGAYRYTTLSGKTGHPNSDAVKQAWPNLRKRETFDLDSGIKIEERTFNDPSAVKPADGPGISVKSGGKSSDAPSRAAGAAGGRAKAKALAKKKVTPDQQATALKRRLKSKQPPPEPKTVSFDKKAPEYMDKPSDVGDTGRPAAGSGLPRTDPSTVRPRPSDQPEETEAPTADGDTEPIAPSESCLLYTSPSPRDTERSRMPSSA